MRYSLNDMYPQSAQSVTTTQETIAENEEREKYSDNVTTDVATGKTFAVDKKGIFGAIVVFGGLLVLIHYID